MLQEQQHHSYHCINVCFSQVSQGHRCLHRGQAQLTLDINNSKRIYNKSRYLQDHDNATTPSAICSIAILNCQTNNSLHINNICYIVLTCKKTSCLWPLTLGGTLLMKQISKTS